MAIFVYFYNSIGTLFKEEFIVNALLIIALIQFSLGIIQFFTGTQFGIISIYVGDIREISRGGIFGGSFRRAMGTFSNPNQYVQFASIGISITLSKYIITKERTFCLISLIGFIALFLNFARGALIAGPLLLITASIIFIIKKRTFRPFLLVIFTILLMGIIIFQPPPILLELLNQRRHVVNEDKQIVLIDEVRNKSMFEALIVASDNIFGTGFGNYQIAKPESSVSRAHNAFLLIFAEGGWLLFICFVIFCLIIVIRLLQLFKRNSNSLLLLASIIFLPSCFLFMNIYLSSMQREVFALYCVLFGSALGIAEYDNRKRRKKNG